MAQPVKVSLEANKEYHYCKCGKSSDNVLCDGSHEGTGILPVSFSVEENKDYYLCSCKKSSNEPFCDGTHSK